MGATEYGTGGLGCDLGVKTSIEFTKFIHWYVKDVKEEYFSIAQDQRESLR